jgi:LDH2 family malate/lactate/ureidoglycolate dehydrogenase
MPTVAAAKLRALMRELLTAAGTPDDIAGLVGDSLVDANLAGHDSHGVMRVLHYLEMVGHGRWRLGLGPARDVVGDRDRLPASGRVRSWRRHGR